MIERYPAFNMKRTLTKTARAELLLSALDQKSPQVPFRDFVFSSLMPRSEVKATNLCHDPFEEFNVFWGISHTIHRLVNLVAVAIAQSGRCNKGEAHATICLRQCSKFLILVTNITMASSLQQNRSLPVKEYSHFVQDGLVARGTRGSLRPR